jgi:hypothetical protein
MHGDTPLTACILRTLAGLNHPGRQLVVLHEHVELPKGTALAYPNSNSSGWPPPPPMYVLAPPTNGVAIAALILVFVFFPIGIVLGHVARGQIKRTGEGGKGLATAALVIGYLQVALIVAVIAMAAILVALGAQ